MASPATVARPTCQGHPVVKAQETTLQELLEGSKQYRVPLYQRTYSWGEA